MARYWNLTGRLEIRLDLAETRNDLDSLDCQEVCQESGSQVEQCQEGGERSLRTSFMSRIYCNIRFGSDASKEIGYIHTHRIRKGFPTLRATL